jgi:hypothetical protein
MYRLAVEPLLGLRLEGDKLRLVPRLPANWQGFKLRYRYRDTVYRIAVMRDEAAASSSQTESSPSSTIAGTTSSRCESARAGSSPCQGRESPCSLSYRPALEIPVMLDGASSRTERRTMCARGHTTCAHVHKTDF